MHRSAGIRSCACSTPSAHEVDSPVGGALVSAADRHVALPRVCRRMWLCGDGGLSIDMLDRLVMPPAPRKSSTSSSSSVLDDLRSLQDRVAGRIRELEGFEGELAELRSVAERLGIDVSQPASGPAPVVAAPKRRAKRATATRRRRSAGESRADQVGRLVGEQPGITVPALGEALGVDSTSLYRVIRKLEAEGRVRKDGRQLQPVGDAASRSDTDDQRAVGQEAS